MKTFKPILVIPGEPNSIFFEIFFKSIKQKKFKSPIILVGSLNLLKLQMKKLNFKKKVKILDKNKINLKKLDNKSINIIDVNFSQTKAFIKITKKSKTYIENCFKESLLLIKKNLTNKLVTGPISKEKFLNKKYLGITEFLQNKTKTKNVGMLIYNKKLSVSPITTHVPVKSITKNINKNNLIKKIKLIKKFYKEQLNINPRIGVLGLNPHCESIDNFNEDEKIIKPVVNYFKKLKFKITGPHPADTCFLKDNRKKYDVIVGMYHDQVLTPIKTLYEYDAINITLGLPFLRVSPDHGPNEKMLGKNLSNPISLIKAILFLDKN